MTRFSSHPDLVLACLFSFSRLIAPTELHREVERVVAAGDDELEVRRAVTMTAYLM